MTGAANAAPASTAASSDSTIAGAGDAPERRDHASTYTAPRGGIRSTIQLRCPSATCAGADRGGGIAVVDPRAT